MASCFSCVSARNPESPAASHRPSTRPRPILAWASCDGLGDDVIKCAVNIHLFPKLHGWLHITRTPCKYCQAKALPCRLSNFVERRKLCVPRYDISAYAWKRTKDRPSRLSNPTVRPALMSPPSLPGTPCSNDATASKYLCTSRNPPNPHLDSRA